MEKELEPMKVTFFGVRGSRPAPDARLAAFGGNTPCVGVSSGDVHVILDAGTGIVNAPHAFWERGGTHIFLSHLHHDHISGLMFYPAIYQKGCDITIHVPKGLEAFFDDYWNAPYFPIPVTEAPASARVESIGDGGAVVVDYRESNQASSRRLVVEALALGPTVHPRGGVMLYRVTDGRKRLVYATDVELADEESKRAVASFANDVDLLILDAHFTDSEYRSYVGWGHNSLGIALDVGEMSNCRRLALFHHHPHRGDDDMMDVERQAMHRLPQSIAAREGRAILL